MPDKFELPPAGEDGGAVCRLLLAEARGPGYASYDEVNTKICMQRMKLILQNRLDNKPSQFGAPGAKTLTDIIKGKGQFAGFGQYPAYDTHIKTRIQQLIDVANSETDPRAEKYRTFLDNAKFISSQSVIADPCPTKLFGWRTEGASSPGGSFVLFDTFVGIDFYTIKQRLFNELFEMENRASTALENSLAALSAFLTSEQDRPKFFPSGITLLSITIKISEVETILEMRGPESE